MVREISHPFSLALALACATIFHQLCREGQLTQEQAEALVALASDRGFQHWVGVGTILRGWALAEQGQAEEGIAQIRQGLATCRATGAEAFRSWWLSMLAEACGKAGQIEEGLNVVAEALAVVDKTGERFYEAELYRLKGELTLQQFNVPGSTFKVEERPASEVRSPESEEEKQKAKSKRQKAKITDPRPLTPDPQGEAEACFLKAIDIARKQQAKSLELRTTMSLVRLWQNQGKQYTAHKVLSEIYNWFTEGFDTKDLQEAQALLEELSCNE